MADEHEGEPSAVVDGADMRPPDGSTGSVAPEVTAPERPDGGQATGPDWPVGVALSGPDEADGRPEWAGEAGMPGSAKVLGAGLDDGSADDEHAEMRAALDDTEAALDQVAATLARMG